MIKIPNHTHSVYQICNKEGTTSTRILSTASFAGKPVSAHATCHPSDEFDAEYGTRLADARCDEKIARKRLKRAYQKRDDAFKQAITAFEFFQKMCQYEAEAEEHYNEAVYRLEVTLSEAQCHCDGSCAECKCHK